jgi:cysteine-rich repeat protein
MKLFIKRKHNLKRLLLVLTALVLLIPSQALAASISITVPDPALPRIVVLCEDLRVRLHVRPADWSNSICAGEAFRIGMRTVDKTVVTNESRTTVNDDVTTELATWDANYPPVTPARCGDNILDVEFGEQCDDGNNIDGDGCSRSCQTE